MNPKRKKVIFLVGMVVLAGVLALAISAIGIGQVTGKFPLFGRYNKYAKDVVMFYGDGCAACTKVEAFINTNKVAEKIPFVELEVFNNQLNADELADKVQTCGLDFKKIGVPFLWDGPKKTCVVGYVDIISYLRAELKKLPKP